MLEDKEIKLRRRGQNSSEAEIACHVLQAAVLAKLPLWHQLWRGIPSCLVALR